MPLAINQNLAFVMTLPAPHNLQRFVDAQAIALDVVHLADEAVAGTLQRLLAG